MANKIYLSIIGILLLLVLALGYVANNRKSEMNKREHNIEVLANENQILKADLEKTTTYNGSLIVTNKELKDALEEREIEYKKIEKELKSEIVMLSDVIANFKPDTIVMVDTLIMEKDGTMTNNFYHRGECFTLSGHNVIDGNIITTSIDNFAMSLYIDLMIDNNYRVIASSDCPNVTLSFNDCYVKEKAYEKKRSRWSIGMNVGLGFQYDLISQRLGFGPQCGFGISYNLK